MSHSHIKNTSVDRIFGMLQRKGISTDNESDIIEWVGEALEQIGAIPQYEDAIALIIVKDFQAHLPSHFHNIIQIARNNVYSGISESALTARDIAVGITDNEASVPVALDQYGMPLNDYELAYYRPFFTIPYDYFKWTNSGIYKRCFTPVRLSQHTFFATVVCKENNYENLYSSAKDEYTLKAGKTLSFSFQDGQIALAYNRPPLDCKGYPMVPDHISYLTACVEYVRWQQFSRDYNMGKEGSAERLDRAEREWIWYCGQARNKSLQIEGIDEHENFLRQRSYLIPQRGATSNYFGQNGR